MSNQKTFADDARTERYFTALLLPHILMSSNFYGMRKLFGFLNLLDEETIKSDDVEIVAELDPIRDAAVELDLSPRRPDLLLRIDNSVLVIEAKFFQNPNPDELAEQISDQKNVINSVIENVPEYAKYRESTFHFMALTVNEIDDGNSWEEEFIKVRWSELIYLFKPIVEEIGSTDVKYALRQLVQAEERQRQSLEDAQPFKTIKTMEKLLKQAPELMKKGRCYIGFDQSAVRLSDAKIKYLEDRIYKYRYDKPKNSNWIPLESLITSYLLKLSDQDVDAT